MLTIVGVDPGTTTAAAILDLDGELIAWTSSKEFSRSELTRYIISQGKPLVIGTDVTPAPSLIAKVGSTFGAEVTVPDHDLGQDEKDGLVSDYDTASMDSHAKDALAAAVNAYNRHRTTIEEIRRKTARAGLEHEQDEIIQQAFTSSRSLQQIINGFKKDETGEDEPEERPSTDVDWEATAREYRDQISEKDREIERLRSYLDDIKEQNQQITQELDDLRSDRRQKALENKEVKRWKQRAQDQKKQKHNLKNRTKELENKLDRYRKALEYIHDGEKLYRICEDADELEAIEGSIAFVRKNLQVEPPANIRAVIVENEEDKHFYEGHGVTAIDYHELRGLKLDQFYIVEKEAVIDELQQTSETFISWLEEYRDRA